MNPGFRPSRPSDVLQIKLLGVNAFDVSGDSPFISDSALHWKYWQHRPDFEEPRSFVIEHKGRVVAHAGVWPISLDGQRGAHLIDWMAAVDAPGAGVSLHQAIQSNFDFLYSIGGAQEALNILPALGFSDVGTANTWARPLRPLRQALHHQRRNWRLAPRYLRNLWHSRFPLRPTIGDWSIALAAEYATPQREAGFFSYLGTCSEANVLTFRLFKGKRDEGCITLATASLQARVAGVWLKEPSAGNWKIALSLAQEMAVQHTDACEILFRGSCENSTLAAKSAGMVLVGKEVVAVRRASGSVTPLPISDQLWDNDAFFLSAGRRPEFAT
jgi:hypothetical protein